MRQFAPTSQDLRTLLRLALPIIGVQVGLMLMGVVDTIVMGHVSARELAAAALGNLYVFGLAVFGMGTLWVLDPVVSQAMGAGDRESAALGIQRGLVLALALGVVLSLACIPAEWVFRALRQEADVVPRAAAFVHWSGPSMPAFFLFVTFRQSLQAMKHTSSIVVTIIVGNVLNLLLNLVFVFGRFGFPVMGAAGSALSSSIGRIVMLGLLFLLARRHLDPMLRPRRPGVLDAGALRRMLAMGVPIGIQSTVEFTTFAAISVCAGWFGAEAIGGHQVAINIASLTFMVPAGLGGASAVLVGHAIGERDDAHARKVAGSALLLGAGFMVLTMTMMLTVPRVLVSLYTTVPGVIAVGASLLPIAGVFQVFDGLQVVAAGVLRGAGDTRASMVANMLGFWLIGMPVSLWLGFKAGLGVVGLWWGFVAGLLAVAVFLLLRVHRRLGRGFERIRMEAETA